MFFPATLADVGGGWGGQTTPLSKLLGAQDTLVLQDKCVEVPGEGKASRLQVSPLECWISRGLV